MQITISQKHVVAPDAQENLVEERLLALGDRLQIDEARVTFERRWDVAPPYRVAIHIVTPGPDVLVEGADQTLAAAVLKTLRQLESKARQRAQRRVSRQRTNLQSPAITRQSTRR